MANVVQSFDAPSGQFLATNFPALQKFGTNLPVTVLSYDAATEEAAFWQFCSTNYASGNLTVTVYWYADTATSGDVVWAAQLAAVTANTDSGDVESKALATANTATDTNLGTTLGRLHSIPITVSNLDSLAADDWAWIRIARQAAAGGDTMTGDAHLVGFTVSYLST